jgi:hypothetical protein
MKTFLAASLAATTLLANMGAAYASDGQATIYTGATSITLPASALTPAPAQAKPQAAAPVRPVRLVLSSPYQVAR